MIVNNYADALSDLNTLIYDPCIELNNLYDIFNILQRSFKTN